MIQWQGFFLFCCYKRLLASSVTLTLLQHLVWRMTSYQNLWPVTVHPHSKYIAPLTRRESDIFPSDRRTKSLLTHPCSCASHRRRWWSINMHCTCERRNTWCLGLMHQLTEAQWREKAHGALGGSKIHWGTKNDQLEHSSRPVERSGRLLDLTKYWETIKVLFFMIILKMYHVNEQLTSFQMMYVI